MGLGLGESPAPRDQTLICRSHPSPCNVCLSWSSMLQHFSETGVAKWGDKNNPNVGGGGLCVCVVPGLTLEPAQSIMFYLTDRYSGIDNNRSQDGDPVLRDLQLRWLFLSSHRGEGSGNLVPCVLIRELAQSVMISPICVKSPILKNHLSLKNHRC